MSQRYLHIQPFLDYLKFEKRFSQHTILSYQTDLISFFDFIQTTFGDTSTAQLTHTFIRSWLASLKEGGMMAKSINRKISTLRSFFKYEMKRGALGQSPMAKVSAPKVEKRLPQFVADKDIATLFNHVTFTDDWKGKTERLLLLIFYNTGMRLSEVIQLKHSNIDYSALSIKVLGKGNKERIIPVNKTLLTELKSYEEEKASFINPDQNAVLLITDKGKPLAPRSVYTSVKKYLSLITTIEKRSPHILRHTFATHLMNNGADLNAVKELLGHSSLASTQVYTHNTIEKLKNIHKKAHPKA
ncbi:MAG TPA: tyrosine-type recombinase/integrase [Chitinophagaceae bacterium]|nr:tyrosine-type recombinase/integrase [Chitinophagaceae bacterium]